MIQKQKNRQGGPVLLEAGNSRTIRIYHTPPMMRKVALVRRFTAGKGGRR